MNGSLKRTRPPRKALAMNRLFRTSTHLLITAAVLALMTAATAQARADGTPVDLHYVAVGVSKVPSLPANNQLRFAHKDAQDLAKAWEAQRGGLYRDVRGEVLTDEKATVADILAALDRLERRAKQGDTAVVSFAGHGAFVGTRSTNWFFVAHDFNVNNLAQTTVTERTLKQRLGRLAQKGVTVILVIDTCHSGVFNADGTGIVLLTACCPKENSFEDASFENGLFTRALLEALGGKADTNNDG